MEKSEKSRFWALRQWLIPEQLRAKGPDAVHRAEVILLIVGLASAVTLVRLVSFAVAGPAAQVPVSATMLLLLLGIPIALRRTASLTIAGNYLGFVVFVAMSISAYFRGGLGTPPMLALGVVPLLTLFAVGWRSGAFWTVASVVEFAAYVVFSPQLPDHFAVETRAGMHFVGFTLFAAFLFGLGVAYEVARKRALAALATSETKRRSIAQEAEMLRADRMASVGQLAAGVAHEANNPLAYVVANLEYVATELAELPATDAEGKRFSHVLEAVTEAQDGISRVVQIVRDLKSFARDSEDRIESTDVNDVIDAATKMAGALVRHRARIVREYDAVAPVSVDPQRLSQVVLNLVINAAQAIPENRPDGLIQIRTMATADGRRVVIEVVDDGEGIAPETLGRVFEPFFTTKPVGVGTGLGLSVCRGIIEGYGGDLSIQSELARGTTVRVTLPAEAAELESRQPDSGAPARSGSRRVNAARRILIIDDEPLVLRAFKRMLNSHDVVAVSGGQEALDLLERDAEFDLILSDVMMPGKSGIDVYRELASKQGKLEKRVVFLTGGILTDSAQELIDALPNPCLEKPVSSERVAELLESTRPRPRFTARA